MTAIISAYKEYWDEMLATGVGVVITDVAGNSVKSVIGPWLEGAGLAEWVDPISEFAIGFGAVGISEMLLKGRMKVYGRLAGFGATAVAIADVVATAMAMTTASPTPAPAKPTPGATKAKKAAARRRPARVTVKPRPAKAKSTPAKAKPKPAKAKPTASSAKARINSESKYRAEPESAKIFGS